MREKDLCLHLAVEPEVLSFNSRDCLSRPLNQMQ